MGLVPRSRRSPGGGHGNLLQYACLENPMDRGAWLAAVHRVTKSRTALEQLNTALNDVLHQMNFVSIYIHTHIYMCVYTYRTVHPQTPEYTFFSSTHETFTTTDQILGCNTSAKKFEKTEIVSSIFYDDNSMKLESNCK